MAFCTKCGAQIPENETACPQCGASAEEKKTDFTASLEVFWKKLTDTPDTTADFEETDIRANIGMAVVSYFWILFLIPLLARPNSRFARYHANQGLLLFLVNVLVGVIGLIPLVGGLLSTLGGIATLVLLVIGIINAANARARELPLVGQFTLISYK